MIDCYIDWCFLDLVDINDLRRHYRPRTRPFRSAVQVRAAIPMTPEAFAQVAWIDALVARRLHLRRTPRKPVSVMSTLLR